MPNSVNRMLKLASTSKFLLGGKKRKAFKAEKSKEKRVMTKETLGESCLGRVSCLIPGYTVILGEITSGVTVGADLGPKHIMIALVHSAQKAGQTDNRQIKPAEKPAIGCMAKLVHTDWVANDISLSFAKHPMTSPQDNEST